MEQSHGEITRLRPRHNILAKPTKQTEFQMVAQSRMNLRQALGRACMENQQPTFSGNVRANPKQINQPKITSDPASSSLRQRRPRKMKPQMRPLCDDDTMVFLSDDPQTNVAVPKRRKAIAIPLASKPVNLSHGSPEAERQETRVLASEYEQAEFLELFGLCTHDVVKAISQRHSKRKRRVPQKVLYNQQQSNTAVRRRKMRELKDVKKSVIVDKNNNSGASKSNGKENCMECKITENTFTICGTCRGKYHEQRSQIKTTGR